MFWTKAEKVIEQALVNNSLLPITTEACVINEAGIDYFGHVVTQHAERKFQSGTKQDNPFLPYEEEMFVADAGESHVCLLNKFPVISPHLLICSREFVPQTSPLELQDFCAWVMGFDSDNVFGFYNSGTMAGASQPHRHMQLVQSSIPLEHAIINHELPFKHHLYQFDSLSGERLYLCYLAGLRELGILDKNGLTNDNSLASEQECKPYNLLLTKHWMLMIPRSTNQVNDVFANGINYSGRFLVKEPEQLTWLKEYGMMQFLKDCSQG